MEEEKHDDKRDSTSRWEDQADWEQRRQTMFGEPDATDKRRRDGEERSGNPRQHKQAKEPSPSAQEMMFAQMFQSMQAMCMEMQRAHQEQSIQFQEAIMRLQQQQEAKENKLSRKIKDFPYKRRKWGADGSGSDMAVQLSEFMPEVERHARRSWGIDCNDATQDPHGEVLKAVESSIGAAPKRAWYDQWIKVAEGKGTPQWYTFKQHATDRFLVGAAYRLRRIMDFLQQGNLKMNNDSFKFNGEIRTKLGRIPDDVTMEEIGKAVYLLKIPDTMSNHLLNIKPDAKWDEWMQYVEDATKKHKRDGTRNHNTSAQGSNGNNSGTPTRSKIHCYKCGSEKHMAHKCDASQDAIKKHRDTCNRCKKWREKSQAEQNSTASSSSSA